MGAAPLGPLEPGSSSVAAGQLLHIIYTHDFFDKSLSTTCIWIEITNYWETFLKKCAIDTFIFFSFLIHSKKSQSNNPSWYLQGIMASCEMGNICIFCFTGINHYHILASYKGLHFLKGLLILCKKKKKIHVQRILHLIKINLFFFWKLGKNKIPFKKFLELQDGKKYNLCGLHLPILVASRISVECIKYELPPFIHIYRNPKHMSCIFVCTKVNMWLLIFKILIIGFKTIFCLK